MSLNFSSMILTCTYLLNSVNGYVAVAKAILENRDSNNILGTIVMEEDPLANLMRISGVISGLTPGPHGFHVHELGDIGSGCAGAGGHFNPRNRTHGAPSDATRHAGDLGNIDADDDGVAKVDMVDRGLSLFGPQSVMGRSVMVHSGVDDLGRGGNEGSLQTGNAGSRIACGIIAVASPDFQPVSRVSPASTVHGSKMGRQERHFAAPLRYSIWDRFWRRK